MVKKNNLLIILFSILIGLEPGIRLLIGQFLPIVGKNFLLVVMLAVFFLSSSINLLRINQFLKYYIIFLIYACGTLVLLPNTEITRGVIMFFMLLSPLLFQKILIDFNNEKLMLMCFFFGFLASVFIILIMPNMYAATSRFGYVKTSSGNLLNPNEIGFYATTLFALSLAARLYINRATFLTLTMFSLGITLATGSKGYLITSFILWSLYIHFTFSNLMHRFLLITSAVIILCVVLIYLSISGLSLEGTRLEQTELNGSIFERFLLILEVFKVWTNSLDQFILGVGTAGSWFALGADSVHIAVNKGADGVNRLHTHNGFLELILNWGLIGILLAGLIGIDFMRTAKKLSIIERQNLHLLFWFLVLTSLTTVPYIHLPWILIASLAIARLRYSRFV